MVIEEKNISPTETLLFFPESLPIRGTFYHTQNTPENLPFIQSIAETGIAEILLLTTDFLYLQSTTPENLDDLTAIALAEIDDYIVSAPATQTAPEQHTAEKIRIILKTVIAPYLQKDGGDIELSDYKNGIVNVRFLGKCHGCPYAEKTLKNRVEKNLIRYLPQVREAVLI